VSSWIIGRDRADSREQRHPKHAACDGLPRGTLPTLSKCGVYQILAGLFTGPWRELAVERQRGFCVTNSFSFDPAREGFVEAARLVFANASENFDACCRQLSKPRPN